MKSRKLLSIILATVIILSSVIISTAEESAHSGYLNMKKLSKAEIVALTRDVNLADTDNFYVTQPSVVYPYTMGEVKAVVQQNALNRFNNYRRLAGLGSVTLDSEYTKYAQGAAVVNAANNVMTHYPEKPDDMPDSFFQVCEYGDCHCNIADYWGYHPSIGPLCFSVDMWMDDSDQYNIAQLGHRRWMLNPTMGKTGFGCATSTEGWLHTAVFAFDNSTRASDYDFISWPPSGYMVNDTSFFTTSCAWSVSLNPNKYDLSNMRNVTVELKNSRGEKWNFGANENDGFFNIDLQGYGSNRNAIIFRPTGINRYDGVYTATVKGLKNSEGKAETLVFEVEFFCSDDISETTTTPTTEPTTVPPTTEPTTEPTTVPPTTEPTTEPTTVPPTTEPTTEPTTVPPTTEPTTEPTTIPPTTEPTTEPTTVPPTTEPTTEPTTVPPTTEPTTEPTTVPPATETTTEPTTNAPAKPLKRGDLNGDDKINASDARTALRISAQLTIGTNEQLIAADVNFDGKVNAIDARKILRISAQLESADSLIPPETTEKENTEETTTEAEEETTTVADEENTTFSEKTEITTALPSDTTSTTETTVSSTEETTEKETSAEKTTVVTETTTEQTTAEATTSEKTTEERTTQSVISESTTKPLPNNEIAVVISDKSDKYHDIDCDLLIFSDVLGENIYAVPKKEAEEDGYLPCSICW